MKDKIKVTEMTCMSASERFSYLACHPAWLNSASPFRLIELSTCSAWGTWYAKEHIPDNMNGYNCTAIKYAQLLRIGRHETFQKPSVAHQHTALLFQITIWKQTLLIKAVFHPASYTSTVDRSLSGILAKLKFVDCACKLCDLKIAHMCYAIDNTYCRVYIIYGYALSRLERNFRILRMCNVISWLCKFSDCVEHIYYYCMQLQKVKVVTV